MSTSLDAALVPAPAESSPDPREPLTRLLRDLHSVPRGLSVTEAERRLRVVGANELARSAGSPW